MNEKTKDPTEMTAVEAELDRRLKVVEGAVGIDLDTTAACSGDPTNCRATPCRDDRCPVRNGLPARTAKAVAVLDWELALVKATVDILVRHGRLPEGLTELAEATARRDALVRRLDAMKDVPEIGESGPLRELFYASLSRAEAELKTAEAVLAEKERHWHAAADKS